MLAWWVERPGPMATRPLRMGYRPDPSPRAGEILLAVHACGVCRTDLHLAEGDLAPHVQHVIPGHEVVGEVIALGTGCVKFRVGDRAGAAWLARTCGSCRFCLRGAENLCLSPSFNGWDYNGGYAELMTVAEDYAYRIPEVFSDEQAAPMLCAGIIGYRALRRAALPPGGRLGIYGFGGSAYLTAQMAMFEGASVYVMTRSEAAQRLALRLGVTFAGGAEARPPARLDAAILFAPAGDLVPVALQALDRGGTLAVAGIHLSDIPVLDYETDLFQERQLRSVTANTRADGQEFFDLARKIPLQPTTVSYPLEEADHALQDLSEGRVTGAAVLVTNPR
ncbi:zinc-dependent alcohol dehydrogenase family protein [Arthrobacter sp. ISL-28]|uniref:zinc-dependent alcohol dehydrogenase family protein n=1 Tax=Arthrobacter sp. ISL-28 TaxID=2819108 RepID=UPI001BE8249A|nr:zinc-dependent alcohol dehydrogenase family protein [Arthrobacter sp. ISL-28]MBT2522083.1 zinc-dependent alcohol dehydrogenase family protein [Arthrobacter sp. ISL-28]